MSSRRNELEDQSLCTAILEAMFESKKSLVWYQPLGAPVQEPEYDATKEADLKTLAMLITPVVSGYTSNSVKAF
jgi:hypothetical protein